LDKFSEFNFIIGVLDSVISKYLATILGYFVISRPFLDLSNGAFKKKIT